MKTKIVFVLLLLACLTPWASPPLALGAGLVLALTLGNPFSTMTGKASRWLLQASVVGLGFGMNARQMLDAGRQGILFAIATIAGTLIVGYGLGRLLGIERRTSHLLSCGTAICGGSAIAAVGPACKASDQEMSVALGTVFILNAVALFLFPVLGHTFGLTQSQFGVWAAVAIHDTSSVVGAAAKYGQESLQIATTVKLARALWIAPLALLTAVLFRTGRGHAAMPWFVVGFILASVLRSLLPAWAGAFNGVAGIARTGLTVTLFLIGAGLSMARLRAVGVRPLVQGVALWIIVGSTTLWCVKTLL